jgi:hypothetical protein
MCGAGDVRVENVPQHDHILTTMSSFSDNVTISGGPAPARAYIDVRPRGESIKFLIEV